MAEESDLERTEEPSQRRLDRARDEGQVARSRELSTFAVLFAGGVGLWLMGSALYAVLHRLMREGLTLDAGLAFHDELLLPHLFTLSLDTLLGFMPLLVLVFLTALLAPLLLNGWMFSLHPLIPDLAKLNPVNGMARMFSIASMVELGKAIAKSVVIGGIGGWAIWHNLDDVMHLLTEPVSASVPHMGQAMWAGFIAIMCGMLLIVAVDVPFQIWNHNRRLKMTREEVRQEAKESEGDPQVRARIRTLQRDLARRRMMAEIPKADVVVTNPTRYAVALRYSEQKMRAPVVVAKGAHLLAAKIREIAAENNIPVLEAPPLARALHRHVELGQAIPEALYTAVAEVLAYVYQLRRYRQGDGNQPEVPQGLPVPPHLDPEAGMTS